MKSVWKYPLQVTKTQIILMPQGAQPLTVQMQDGGPCLWAMVNPDPGHPKVERVICTAGTGHGIEDEIAARLAYVATYQTGAYVFHVFDGSER